jgi:hypothetical protein
VCRQYRPTRRTGFDQADRKAPRDFYRGDGAAGHHHQKRATETILAEAVLDPLEVAVHQGANVGIGDRRRNAVVLADLRADLAGYRYRNARRRLPEDGFDAVLVFRIGVAVHQPYGDCGDALFGEGASSGMDIFFAKPDQHAAVGGHALTDFQPQPARHERRRSAHEYVRLFKPMLVCHFQGISKALGAQQADFRAFALDQRIGRQRGPVNDQVDIARLYAGLVQCERHAFQEPELGLPGGGQHFADGPLSAVFQDHVGESPADVDGQADSVS